MFGNLNPTPWDLRFGIFGIPVRVMPSFWLVGTILGWGAMQAGFQFLLIWLVCLFVSILVHELGHALSAESFGWRSEIVLYHFGGLALFAPGYGYTRGKSIFISFAGPGAGFLLFGLVIAFEYSAKNVPALAGLNLRSSLEAQYALLQMKWINLAWGLVNLLPVLPFDGGRISQEVCSWFSPRRGNEIAIKLAIVVSAAVALWFLQLQLMYAGLLFGFLCFQNVQALQQRSYDPW